jgi:hypothetical protein
MIKLQPSQLETLQQRRDGDFTRQLAAFLRAEFGPELEKVGEPQLQAICEHVVADAAALGIQAAAPVAQLACLQIGSGGAVLKEPDVRAYLMDQGVDEQTRVQLLVDALSAQGE